MISFIVLHYKNIKETLCCLEHLKKITEGYKNSIIVVDNNTLNAKDKKQIQKYTKDILMLDKNYGFAKANNKGIEYAEKKYNPDFYCVINNDVFIEQKDFISKVNTIYEEYKFDILGPRINSPTGDSVNPFPVFKDKKTIEFEIKKCNKLIKIYKSSFLTILLNIYLRTKRIFKKNNKPQNGKQIMLGIALHGCAIIFSKKYIKKYTNGFYDETFLFHEEEFLYQRVIKDKLISIYEPDLYVYHKEGSSVKYNIKKSRMSKLFREQERLKSLILLLKQM